MPVVLMLLLVYVFGNAFNVGEHYIEYATPGLILLAIMLRAVGHRGIGEHRHDQGHHQPVQGHECLPRCRPDRSRRGHHAGQYDRHRGHHRHGVRAGVPVACDPPGLARRDRYHRGGSFRGRLAHGRAGNGRENSGIRRPCRRAADPAALPEQRDRAGRQDGTGCPAIRGVSALHADHRIIARIARRHPVGRLRGRRSRLVRRDRPRRIPVVARHIQQRA